MSKKNASTVTTTDMSAEVISSGSTVAFDMEKPAIRDAIADGKTLIAAGKSKADAARAIFDRIKDEAKDVVVAAFVEGATLTPKGALTYWYNCRRRATKQAARSN